MDKETQTRVAREVARAEKDIERVVDRACQGGSTVRDRTAYALGGMERILETLIDNVRWALDPDGDPAPQCTISTVMTRLYDRPESAA